MCHERATRRDRWAHDSTPDGHANPCCRTDISEPCVVSQMSHSKTAASPIQALEITRAGPPETPPRGTKRTAEQTGAQDADTPNAMRRTVSLPQRFGMGTINMKTTAEHMRAQTGRDLVYGLVSDNAIIKTKTLYKKSKANIGSNVILITEDEDKGIISVCW